MLFHVSSLRWSSGHSGPVLTLKHAAHASLSSPPIAGAGCMPVTRLLLRWKLRLGVYSVGFLVFFFSSWLCSPLRFQNCPQSRQREGFLLFGNFSSFRTPFPGQVSTPNSVVSLFVFYILSYLLSKRMGCLSGCLVSSASIEKLFCGSCSAFK